MEKHVQKLINETKYEESGQSKGKRNDENKLDMATHSSTLAWRIPWTEEPGRLQSMGSQEVRHDLVTKPPPPDKSQKFYRKVN